MRSRIEKALPETLIALEFFRQYREVGIGDYRVSSDTMASFFYSSCTALVLYDGNEMGLSHSPNGSEIEKHVGEMRGLLGEELECIPIASVYMDDVRRACESEGIAILDEGRYYLNHKDVIAIPSLREVWVYSKQPEGSAKKKTMEFPSRE